jgi:hypothetical protein
LTTETATELVLPLPPRPVTPRARRRSWNERGVRLWLILTVAITLIAIYFAFYYVQRALHERRLIERGTVVQAKVELIDQFNKPDRSFTRDQVRNVRVRYSVPGGKEYTQDMEFPIKADSYIKVGDVAELRADPDDPTVVTAQTKPRGWLASLAAPALLAPLAALLLVLTLWQRSRVLNVWQTGEPVEATIIDWHRSGIAPKSVVMRFSLKDGDDRRVFSTLWPHSAGELQVGETVLLVAPAGDPARAVVAELYM